MSKVLKDIIVDSIKIAASFKKAKASIEDFIFALLKTNTSWFIGFLDFL